MVFQWFFTDTSDLEEYKFFFYLHGTYFLNSQLEQLSFYELIFCSTTIQLSQHLSAYLPGISFAISVHLFPRTKWAL